MNKRTCCYVWDESLIEQCDRLPAVVGRATMVNDLIVSYNLNRHMKVVRSSPATYEDLVKFHSELYVDYLKSVNEIDEDYMATTQDEQNGIGYDCPPVSNMFELVSVVAGGSLTAAKCLMGGVAEVAINWCGGWHHAQKVFSSVWDKFLPDAVVLQCGADALARDPQGGGNVTTRGYCACVAAVLDKRKPTLLLGGGGYNHANAARLWTSITALAVRETLEENIPEHSHWTKYGPDYMLPVEPTLARDTNKRDYLDKCIAVIRDNLRKYVEPSKFQERMLKRRINTEANSEPNRIKNCDNDGLNRQISIDIRNSTKIPKTAIRNKCSKDVTAPDVYDFID